MENEIVNRVASSGIITFDLSEFYPDDPVVGIDLKEYLFQGLILKEKDFREALLETDWNAYAGKHIGIYCSSDAIIPVWAYMLMTSYLQPFARSIHYGNKSAVILELMKDRLIQQDPVKYSDQRVVVKGCGDKEIPAGVYLEATRFLRPYVKSIMYGEPCSTVPVYKKPRHMD